MATIHLGVFRTVLNHLFAESHCQLFHILLLLDALLFQKYKILISLVNEAYFHFLALDF